MSTAIEHEHSFDLFGTRVRLLVAAPAGGAARCPNRGAARPGASAHVSTATLTRFEPESELSRLNAARRRDRRDLADLCDAIAAALYAAQISDGLVDPTLLAAARAGRLCPLARGDCARRPGARRSPPRRERRRAARAPRSAPGENIDARPSRRHAPAPRGHAARPRRERQGDGRRHRRAHARRLPRVRRRRRRRHPPRRHRSGAARRCDIEHPLTGETAHELVRSSGAVATSGLRTRVWRTAEGYAHHLIDPARGTPAWTGVIQATALAPPPSRPRRSPRPHCCAGPTRGHALLARRGGALILDDGELVLAGDLQPTPDARSRSRA